jgi:hypothetical protein
MIRSRRAADGVISIYAVRIVACRHTQVKHRSAVANITRCLIEADTIKN